MTTGRRRRANSVISLNEQRNVRCQFHMLEIQRDVVREIHVITAVTGERE